MDHAVKYTSDSACPRDASSHTLRSVRLLPAIWSVTELCMAGIKSSVFYLFFVL